MGECVQTSDCICEQYRFLRPVRVTSLPESLIGEEEQAFPVPMSMGLITLKVSHYKH